MSFDLRRLRYFVQVAELESFTRASGVLGVAQSALSRQVRELEREVGGALFARTGHGASPTELAQQLLPQARSLLLQADRLAEDIRANRDQPAGQVTLAVIASLGPMLLTPLLTRIHQRLPNVQMRILEGLSHHIRDWLAMGRADIGVPYDAQRIGGGDEFLFAVRLYLVGRRGDPRLARPATPLAEIRSLPLALPGAPNELRTRLDRAFARKRLHLRVAFEMDSVPSMKELASLGEHYTVLPLHAVWREIKAGTLAVSPLVDPVITRQVMLTAATQRPLSRAGREVMKLIREEVRRLPAEVTQDASGPDRPCP